MPTREETPQFLPDAIARTKAAVTRFSDEAETKNLLVSYPAAPARPDRG
jgi:hypothetical protein